MKACRIVGVNQAFTNYSNPEGNAGTERYRRTLKEELVWINEFTSPGAFLKALDRWIDGYIANYLHSILGYRSPVAIEAEHLNREAHLADAC
jgi:putative transposase